MSLEPTIGVLGCAHDDLAGDLAPLQHRLSSQSLNEAIAAPRKALGHLRNDKGHLRDRTFGLFNLFPDSGPHFEIASKDISGLGAMQCHPRHRHRNERLGCQYQLFRP